jgi:hypothetical protein
MKHNHLETRKTHLNNKMNGWLIFKIYQNYYFLWYHTPAFGARWHEIRCIPFGTLLTGYMEIGAGYAFTIANKIWFIARNAFEIVGLNKTIFVVLTRDSWIILDKSIIWIALNICFSSFPITSFNNLINWAILTESRLIEIKSISTQSTLLINHIPFFTRRHLYTLIL